MLRNQPPNADVYCLLGVIVQTRSDFVQAETHFHKSLFLEPDHVESLTHLLLLAQLRGDAKQIANYQRRLERHRN
jgi:chemotaxis protein methyltransferase WspC